MRSNGDIQFTPVELPEDPPRPDWLTRFMEWLTDLLSPAGDALAGSWPVLFWILVGIGVLLLVYAIYRLVDPKTLRLRKGKNEVEDWTPGEQAALALLEEADRLAAEGLFDEATHLLLQRSVGQIAEIRPDLIDPSSTAREIASLQALPDTARHAFTTIAERVERSLFALRGLGSEDWQAARAAYAEFALGYRGVGA